MIDILPYHKLGIEKYKRLRMRYKMVEMRPPTSEEMMEIAERLRSFGLDAKVGA